MREKHGTGAWTAVWIGAASLLTGLSWTGATAATHGGTTGRAVSPSLPRPRVSARPARSARRRLPGRRYTPTHPYTHTPTQRVTRVLDIQNLTVVPTPKLPNRIPTCDVLVVGGGLGGVAAAEALVRGGATVILTEPTSQLGGQLTSQAVSTPDENSYIERDPGSGTRTYRELREQLRARYAAMPGIKPGRAQNVGMCWVSRISAEPAAWEAVIRERLEPLRGDGGIREILTRHQLVQVVQFPQSGRYHFADLVDLDTRRVTRVAARYLLDASEMGDALALAGSPWTVGAEARATYGEPSAPETAHPEWIQSLTYCFAVRWDPEGPRAVVTPPAEYEAFKALGEYTLAYDYSDDRGRVYYKVFEKAPRAGGPFWTYRRLIAASSFSGRPEYAQDLALINWRGNDFHLENPIGKSPEQQARVLRRARDFARGFLYWLQTECPRDDGGFGYPEMQLAEDVMGSPDGFAVHPYIRESRRLLAETTLTQNDMLPDPEHPEVKWGREFFDSVGVGLYAIDIHPAKGEPPLLSRALPFHLPLGAFIPRSGPPNVLPAAKDWGGSRLALAAGRMHPTEWLAGEVAGHLAAFCLRRDVEPAAVRGTPELLAAFQQELKDAGVPIRWREIIP